MVIAINWYFFVIGSNSVKIRLNFYLKYFLMKGLHDKYLIVYLQP